MLQLTSRSNYAVLAVYYIAQQATKELKLISIDEIVAHTKVSKPYLSKILQDLNRGGILASRRGTGGGYSLARPSHEISLENIIEAVEGKIALVTCLSPSNHCHLTETCPISPLWGGIQNLITILIGNITIADILNDEKREDILHQLEVCQVRYKKMIQNL